MCPFFWHRYSHCDQFPETKVASLSTVTEHWEAHRTGPCQRAQAVSAWGGYSTGSHFPLWLEQANLSIMPSMWMLEEGYKYTYLQNTNRPTDSENKLIVTKEDRWGEGWTGGVGLTYAHCSLWNDWPIETCCRGQRTLPNILGPFMWEKHLKESGGVSMQNWISLSKPCKSSLLQYN